MRFRDLSEVLLEARAVEPAEPAAV